ncbi:polysaccharide deacetylase family protein [Simkania negevensis]|uniref:Polysaccharide deacetylase n=1 Tax=Simkania negevensis (strain ATCC VR-1471 / DSM 27360 / Z) TaxID=331113 RepID=F8L8I4_SIMNZ|nr:polysaccharide deacetylase family protein [Simkania negevensis]MCB1074650.1 polysaccharide deacetylase family protein [Simkania sp.]CCB89113.1 polysaccharide deacetylase [Simkania negevensis Z]
MLLSLLYHRVGNGKYANPLSFFKEHFSWIQESYNTLHPGDPLGKEDVLCLTFDDATFDFYHYIFPLLKTFELKAVLSVPTAYIPDQTTLSTEMRLEKIETLQSDHPPLPSPAYCTWSELEEMHNSGLVHIASHSVNHVPLTDERVDPEHELCSSKTLLEKMLNTQITTFVYPYGKFNTAVHFLAKKHYSYIMRIGNAINFNWQNRNQLIYRINADAAAHPKAPFHPSKRIKYLLRYLFNTLRKK